MYKIYLTLLSTFILATFSFPVFSEPLENKHVLIVTLVEIEHIPDSTIICGLFEHATGFPLDATQAIATTKASITGNQAKCIFRDLKTGDYAIAVLHDENGNGKVDTDVLGDPDEGWATSNNITHDLRAPDFEESKFSVNQPVQNIFLEMHY